MVLLFWFMSRQGKKAQQRQRDKVEEGLVPGGWVQTIARTYHQVVEVNGDIITLSNPDGSEYLVHRTGIAQPTQSPYELMSDGSHDDLDDEPVTDAATGTSVDDARESAGDDAPAVDQENEWFDDGRPGRDDRS